MVEHREGGGTAHSRRLFFASTGTAWSQCIRPAQANAGMHPFPTHTHACEDGKNHSGNRAFLDACGYLQVSVFSQIQNLVGFLLASECQVLSLNLALVMVSRNFSSGLQIDMIIKESTLAWALAERRLGMSEVQQGPSGEIPVPHGQPWLAAL